jgi:hypothetical protein
VTARVHRPFFRVDFLFADLARACLGFLECALSHVLMELAYDCFNANPDGGCTVPVAMLVAKTGLPQASEKLPVHGGTVVNRHRRAGAGRRLCTHPPLRALRVTSRPPRRPQSGLGLSHASGVAVGFAGPSGNLRSCAPSRIDLYSGKHVCNRYMSVNG